MSSQLFLGFDIGGTKCSVVVGASPLKRMAARVVATDTSIPPDSFVERLLATADALLADSGLGNNDLAGIGVVCGGPLDEYTGRILGPPNLPGWDDVAILDAIEKRFGRRGRLMNDANAGALAEWHYGAGSGHDSVVFLTFGTGMGAGMILNGAPYSGVSGNAGEVGRLRMTMELEGVGAISDTFEGFCSGGGLARLANFRARHAGVSAESLYELDEGVSAKSIFNAARRGNAHAERLVDLCAEALGHGLAVLIDTLNPAALLLGSIFVRGEDLLRPKMDSILEARVLPQSLESTRVLPAGLGEAVGDVASLHMAQAVGVEDAIV